MILDVTAAAVAVDAAALYGPTASVDEVSDAGSPDLDGSHLIVHIYGGDLDRLLPDLLSDCTPTDVTVGWVSRGTILIGPDGRAGIAVGHGYVVEPAAAAYCLTPPERSRWAAAYVHPALLVTVVSP